MKQNILVVADYKRYDYVEQFNQLADTYNVKFIFYPFQYQINTTIEGCEVNYLLYHQYESAFQLINLNSIQAILFQSLYDHNEYALLFAAKKLSIPTIFIDHGLIENSISSSFNKRISLSNKIASSLDKLGTILSKQGPIYTLKNRRFFLNTLQSLPKETSDFILNKVKRYRSLSAIRRAPADYRIYLQCDHYLAYSEYNAKEQLSSRLFSDVKIWYTGIPQFDDIFRRIAKVHCDDKLFVYIDQPYCNFHRYGWTIKRKVQFLIDLKQQLSVLGLRFKVKPHPLESEQVWHMLQRKLNEDITFSSLDSEFLSAKHVMTYNSTLALPFATRAERELWILKQHPDGTSSPSMIFHNFGIGKQIKSFQDISKDIEKAMSDPSQNNSREHFTQEVLYKADGQAMVRFKNFVHKIVGSS